MNAKRKEAYLRKHPETGHGGDRKSDQDADSASCPSFADDQSAKTGVSKRTVQVNAERGEKVTPGSLAMHRECEHCGGPIPDHKKASAMYCSKRCNVASSNAAISAARAEAKAGRWCAWCGDPIPTRRNLGARFCCVTCERQARYRANIEARPVQTCPVCGGGFQAKHHAGTQTYCSHKCAQATYRVTGPITCGHCGTTVATPRQGQRYCSARCREQAFRGRKRDARG